MWMLGLKGFKIYQCTNGYRGQRKELREKENNTWSSLPSDHFNYRYYGDLPLMTTLTVTAITRIVHPIRLGARYWCTRLRISHRLALMNLLKLRSHRYLARS